MFFCSPLTDLFCPKGPLKNNQNRSPRHVALSNSAYDTVLRYKPRPVQVYRRLLGQPRQTKTFRAVLGVVFVTLDRIQEYPVLPWYTVQYTYMLNITPARKFLQCLSHLIQASLGCLGFRICRVRLIPRKCRKVRRRLVGLGRGSVSWQFLNYNSVPTVVRDGPDGGKKRTSSGEKPITIFVLSGNSGNEYWRRVILVY